jgi:PAS domain S-box-containing protein
MNDELRFIWEVSPIGIAKTQRDGRFIAVNPTFCEIVGYSETELLNRTWQSITHPDDLVADNTEAENLANNGNSSYQMVKRYISKDGRSVWVNLHVHSIRDSSQAFSYYFVFAAELTPVGSNAGNFSNKNSNNSISGKHSLWEYIRDNPKEAIIIAAIIFLLGQGRNITELIRLAWPQ